MTPAPTLVSIVIPCFNEKIVLAETQRQPHAFTATHADHAFELLYIDDPNRTLAILRTIAAATSQQATTRDVHGRSAPQGRVTAKRWIKMFQHLRSPQCCSHSCSLRPSPCEN